MKIKSSDTPYTDMMERLRYSKKQIIEHMRRLEVAERRTNKAVQEMREYVRSIQGYNK